ncbi:2-oxoglutarate dehydrogenase complex dihydrolipoyllysine-residue succinyltransferase [Acidomonas methanolica]|uniref:Dihydrolipoyllysine-residue succinyltransferase component of 2-oxoglutarate dehydrogenase complex n=3 Tax=Acidomonas methanolica TaxID=437 RepID=A0A023D8I4_ACIMT|nr:2-oxoglutarate dehydrogenase complex dihydrolipoyllysine-residue succinyltransferase [Acidomonas methanolica]TCS25174.1 2-oxoglutarate dehydrogenase E2 component [Acidomonas methanolica]GAJ30111.1 dihydrolipoamide acetyltransferase/2-oxoglutarate dehydrogenase E2 component [Acidomonas methanolica NBRC 104435]GEK99669.1 dihydrolipoyllysine-residue succinyltransferase component of 2-oxoglutarate dehydrogenase complex [Acidomonas methanolica NBRC 104435]
MSVEIKVPTLGESVVSAIVARWLKQPGDTVSADEPVVELETDKVSVEVGGPRDGVLGDHVVAEGAEVEVGALLATLEEAGAAPGKTPKAAAAPAPAKTAPAPAKPAPVTSAPAASGAPAFPAAAKMMKESGIAPGQIAAGSGKDGRVTKGDVMAFRDSPPPATPAAAPSAPPRQDDPREERVRMTRLRSTIAARLKEAQNTAAILTTFNEVDMSAAMAMRAEFKEVFEKRHGVKLGFMSIFARACVAALREFPAVNAEISGQDIIYRRYVNMGIAVGGPNGLVVPVVRDIQDMNFAEIEKAIGALGKKAREGALKLDDLSGGTFSVTNGGIYGSLMSTPILNPPQSGILGMHKIQDRPIAVNGKVEIRPMMYIALSYDHRIIDGKEAVSFLVRVKEGVEEPRRLLLDL